MIGEVVAVKCEHLTFFFLNVEEQKKEEEEEKVGERKGGRRIAMGGWRTERNIRSRGR